MLALPFRRWVAAVAVILFGVMASCTASPDRPSAPGSGPPKAPPDYPAMARELDRRITEGPPELQEVRAVLASVGNKTVLAHYPAGRYRPGSTSEYAHVYSVTKSVTSILVGIALDEGHLRSVDQALGELLPKYRSKMTKQVAGITLRQLLTHTSGIAGNSASSGSSALAADDAVETILTAPLLNDPGTVFDYSNPGAHLVTAILAAATGRSVLSYAQEKLFDPLAIKTRPAYVGRAITAVTAEKPSRAFLTAGFAWGTDRQGINSGCCFLKLTAPDMIKIGELYENDGVWHGQRLVSAQWVRDSTAPQVTPEQLGPEGGYGYFWWLDQIRGHRAFLAVGSFGQLVAVVPELELVIAVSTGDQRLTEDIDLAPLVEVIAEGVAR